MGIQVRYSLRIEMNTYIRSGTDRQFERESWRPVLSGRAVAISGKPLKSYGKSVYLVIEGGKRIEVPVGTYEIHGDVLDVQGAPADLLLS